MSISSKSSFDYDLEIKCEAIGVDANDYYGFRVARKNWNTMHAMSRTIERFVSPERYYNIPQCWSDENYLSRHGHVMDVLKQKAGLSMRDCEQMSEFSLLKLIKDYCDTLRKSEKEIAEIDAAEAEAMYAIKVAEQKGTKKAQAEANAAVKKAKELAS